MLSSISTNGFKSLHGLNIPARSIPSTWIRRVRSSNVSPPNSPPKYPAPCPVDDPPVVFPIQGSTTKPQFGSNASKFKPKTSDIKENTELWKIYMSEGQEWDRNQINNWNANMDVILIFAGLFSAILTAFLIEFYRNLSPDSGEIAALALLEVVQLLKQPNGTSTTTAESALNNFKPSEISLWVNALWFTSLILSLGAAMTVMLVKQWFQFYMDDVNKKNTYSYAQHRQYKYNSLNHWKIPQIVHALPLVMHLSVWLFLAGLVVQLQEINSVMSDVVLAGVLVLLAGYIITLILPMIYTSCPYRTFITATNDHVLRWSTVIGWHILYGILYLPELWRSLSVRSELLAWVDKTKPSLSSFHNWKRSKITKLRLFLSSPRKLVKLQLSESRHKSLENLERNLISKKKSQLDLDALLWLLEISQEQKHTDLALFGLSRIKPETGMITRILRSNIFQTLLLQSYVPLLNYNVELMLKKILIITPENCVENPVQLKAAGKFMQSLMAIWHHSVYFSEDFEIFHAILNGINIV
ncbi:hypothetical protein BDQ17DRAFT_348920 [Cyathus striatus]|nr:hypothetical protein BDQ17DRAFT_348920 [Cyathus striatus]